MLNWVLPRLNWIQGLAGFKVLVSCLFFKLVVALSMLSFGFAWAIFSVGIWGYSWSSTTNDATLNNIQTEWVRERTIVTSRLYYSKLLVTHKNPIDFNSADVGYSGSVYTYISTTDIVTKGQESGRKLEVVRIWWRFIESLRE